MSFDTKCFVIGVIYFNPSHNLSVILNLFQLSLNDILERYPTDVIIIGGDFNCRIGGGDVLPSELFDGTNLHTERLSNDIFTDGRGESLLEFMIEMGFVNLNGRTMSDYPANVTFCSSRGKSAVDLIWMFHTGLNLVKDLHVDLDMFYSDHFPLILSIVLPITEEKNNPNQLTNLTKKIKFIVEKSLDYKQAMLTSDRIMIDFLNTDVNIQNDNLISAMTKVVEELNFFKKGDLYRDISAPWFDAECARSKNETKLALKKCRKSNFSEPDKTLFLNLEKKLQPTQSE